MALAEELERIVELVGATAVLAAEAQPGERVYVCAFEIDGGARTWLALSQDGEPISERRRVRDAVAILSLCELAAESAAGGDLDELRSQLAALRLTEDPPGIDEADQATLELQQAGVPAERMRRAKDVVDSPDSGHVYRPVPSDRAQPPLAATLPFTFSRSPVAAVEAPDQLGGHTREALHDWLGMPDAEIDELDRQGALV